MLLQGMRNLLGWPPPPSGALPPPAEVAPSLVAADGLPDDDDPVWPTARIGVAEALWGEGFLFPGGGEEVVRLAKPLGLSAASSLLLIGAGSGGPPRRIAAEFGVWVTGYEANRHLAAIANERSRRAGLGRRAQVEPWDPKAPKFPRRYFHHGMTIGALDVVGPEPLFHAISRALKPGGQLALLETVADVPLEPADMTSAIWMRLDHREARIPSELIVTDALGRFGFDVRIVEDLSRRDMRGAIDGWRRVVQTMATTRPTPRRLSFVLREAELWLARFRLMRTGKLRLVRWHAIATGGG